MPDPAEDRWPSLSTSPSTFAAAFAAIAHPTLASALSSFSFARTSCTAHVMIREFHHEAALAVQRISGAGGSCHRAKLDKSKGPACFGHHHARLDIAMGREKTLKVLLSHIFGQVAHEDVAVSVDPIVALSAALLARALAARTALACTSPSCSHAIAVALALSIGPGGHPIGSHNVELARIRHLGPGPKAGSVSLTTSAVSPAVLHAARYPSTGVVAAASDSVSAAAAAAKTSALLGTLTSAHAATPGQVPAKTRSDAGMLHTSIHALHALHNLHAYGAVDAAVHVARHATLLSPEVSAHRHLRWLRETPKGRLRLLGL
mmetsp:Transcript_757/g.1818  ORF Transcript_757/g.1818 Transcript_757/m.1818 type:complete len:319 (+) Transcript_757:1324-2280(+)